MKSEVSTMRSQYKDGEVFEYRAVDDEGKPDGGWVAFRYTKDGIQVDRLPSETGECLSMRQETQPMEVTHPLNPLADALCRLLPLAERWLEKQVGNTDTDKPAKGLSDHLSPKEAAIRMRVHVQTVQGLCRSKRLNAKRHCGRYWISPEAIDDFLHEQQTIHGERRRSTK
jgi:hypothetical protein